jgi:oligopeptide transport system substrate-binding protein
MKKLLLLFTLLASVALLAACEETVETVTVTFDMDGATAVPAITVPSGTVPVDFAALASAYASVPVRGLDIFAGWFTNTAKTIPFDPTVALTNDVTVYARFNDFRTHDYSRAQTYNTTTSAVSTMNPLNTSEAAASDLADFLLGSYYGFDFDWAKAVDQGVAPAPYDFSLIRNGDFSINALDYNYVLDGILAAFPENPTTGESFARDEYTLDEGQYLDLPLARVETSTSWVYTLKPNQTFEDGTPLNADVVLYTIKQYIDPIQNNFRQDLVTSSDYIDMVGSFEYFMQGKEVPVGHPLYVAPTIPNPDYEPETLPNPDYEPATIANPSFDDTQPESAENPATIANPDYSADPAVNPATIANPDYDADPAVNPLEIPNPAFTTQGLYPAVDFSTVGFRKVSDLSFEFTSNTSVTQLDAIGNIGLIALVHPESYEAGFQDDTKAVTNYGSIDNPLVSYGPYVLKTWEDGTVYVFNKNLEYINAEAFNYKSYRLRVLIDQTAIVNEFKEGNLNVAGVSGDFFPEFKDNPGLYIIPGNSAFRLAISLVRNARYSGGETVLRDPENPTAGSPLVQELAFRRALYFAIDRLEFAQEVFPPAVPNLGMVSSIHKVTMEAPEFFQESAEYLAMADTLGINTQNNGFDPVKAKQLFDEAYANLVTAGTITQGEIVDVDYTFGESEVATKIAAWMKDMLEGVFNGDGPKRVNIVTRGLDVATGGAFSQARTNGDFDLMLTGISGATYDAAFFSGFVYNNYIGSFLAGKGHNPGDTPVEVSFKNLFDLLSAKPAAELTEDEADALDVLDANGVFKGTFHEAYLFYGGTSVFDSEYPGRTQDLNNLTVALEFVVLSQGINVPLYSTVSAVVYGDVYIDVPAWHSFLSFGGSRYRWLTSDPDFQN